MNDTLKTIFFDCRWDNEPQKSQYQLIIPKETRNGSYEFKNGYFVYTYKTKRAEKEVTVVETTEEKYFLKMKYELWLRKADPIDVEPFLEHHVNFHQNNRIEFLKYLRAITASIENLSEWKDEFEGKKAEGLKWIKKQIENYQSLGDSSKKKGGKRKGLGNTPDRYSFENVFTEKITPEQFLMRLRLCDFIDEENKWRKQKIDLRGLVKFLIKNQYTHEIHQLPLYRILSTKIIFKTISKIDGEIYDEYIKQYKRVFSPNQ